MCCWYCGDLLVCCTITWLGCWIIFQLLVCHSAPLFTDNSQKQTPCDCAEKCGNENIALYLESKMVFSVSLSLPDLHMIVIFISLGNLITRKLLMALGCTAEGGADQKMPQWICGRKANIIFISLLWTRAGWLLNMSFPCCVTLSDWWDAGRVDWLHSWDRPGGALVQV